MQVTGHISSEDAVSLGPRMKHKRDTIDCHLTWTSVGLANLGPPVASLHREDGKLGQDDCPSDGSGYFLGAVKTKTNIIILDSGKSLEPTPLKNQLLHWLDF